MIILRYLYYDKMTRINKCEIIPLRFSSIDILSNYNDNCPLIELHMIK